MIEQDTRYIIDCNLVNKGWILDINNPEKNVFFETAKTEEQKKKLKGKRPDYILYQKIQTSQLPLLKLKKVGQT